MERRTDHGPTGSADRRTGARGAFNRYVVPEIPDLRTHARGLTGTLHDADDLVQETLLRAYRASARFDGRHPRAWLHTIMRHAWFNENRKPTPIPVPDEELVSAGQTTMTSTWGVPEHVLAERILDPDLQAALDHLKPHHRAVMEAVTMQGLSCRDTARTLSVPVGTVLSRLYRARRQLRAELTSSRSIPSKPTVDVGRQAA